MSPDLVADKFLVLLLGADWDEKYGTHGYVGYSNWSWRGSLFTLHILHQIQELLPEENADTHIAILVWCLMRIVKRQYKLFWEPRGYNYVFSTHVDVLDSLAQSGRTNKVFQIVLDECYYYGECSRDFTNQQIWKDYEEYKLKKLGI